MIYLKPCPFCGSDFLKIHVDRMRRSFITCDCGASMSIDCSVCNDALTGELVDELADMWNERAEDEPEVD